MKRMPANDRELHVCATCRSPLMEPVEWTEAPDDRWLLELRCPECGDRFRGVVDNAAVKAYSDRLDRATEQIVSDLRQLGHEVFVAQAERFIASLRAGAIHPMDF
jgi:DNA-directed RNA polymerase subunit RPC12/RpoP